MKSNTEDRPSILKLQTQGKATAGIERGTSRASFQSDCLEESREEKVKTAHEI